MEDSYVAVSNMVFSGLITSFPLNDLLKTIQERRADLWSCQDHPKVYQPPLVTTMMLGNVYELGILLRYGFEKKVSKKLQILKALVYINDAIRIDTDRGTNSIDLPHVVRFLQKLDPVSERRCRLIIETFAVASCLYLSPGYFHPTYLCYEMAWMSTPEPYVKLAEMFEGMIRLCGPKDEDGIRRVCQCFKEKVGEIAEGPKEPRPLKHLSRCSIRRALTRTFKLPHIIDELKLPDSLKDYVRLGLVSPT